MAYYSRRQALVHAAGAMASACAPGWSWAQKAKEANYPSRPVRIVVGYAPGGAADIASRMLAEWMSTHMGQSFVVDNKPGASGTLAANMVSKSPNDGYTLFYGAGFGITLGSGANKIEYKPEQLFSPVNLMVEVPLVLVVNPSQPVRNVQELVTYARSKAGSLNYASYGKGTNSHLAAEALISQEKLKIEHVLYKGSSPALLALRSGEVQMMFDTVASASAQIKAGALRALAVTSGKRMGQLPNVPTMQEAGMPGISMSGWMGMYAPKGTPSQVITALSKEISAYLGQSSVQEKIENMGFLAQDRGPDAFRDLIVSETRRIERLVADAKIDLD